MVSTFTRAWTTTPRHFDNFHLFTDGSDEVEGARHSPDAHQWGGGGDWYVVVGRGRCTVHDGVSEEAQASLMADAKDYLDVHTGRLGGAKAVMLAKLKISGNPLILAKWQRWFPQG
jgi:hypothetical protein